MRYKTIRDLIFAYEKHEISDKTCPLIIDYSTTTVRNEDGEIVFEGGKPKELLKEILHLIGVPWENA